MAVGVQAELGSNPVSRQVLRLISNILKFGIYVYGVFSKPLGIFRIVCGARDFASFAVKFQALKLLSPVKKGTLEIAEILRLQTL